VGLRAPDTPTHSVSSSFGLERLTGTIGSLLLYRAIVVQNGTVCKQLSCSAIRGLVSASEEACRPLPCAFSGSLISRRPLV